MAVVASVVDGLVTGTFVEELTGGVLMRGLPGVLLGSSEDS